VAERVAEMTERAGTPIPLVGWSLGGYLAREVARDHPSWVEQIITLGSPVMRGSGARFHRPIEPPITAIFSRNDGIVAWQACIDDRSPHVEHIEVDTTHVGLGFSPDVFEILAKRLAPKDRGDRDADPV
jgi:pimeloyl-ACP methyl ester carboxylesterase